MIGLSRASAPATDARSSAGRAQRRPRCREERGESGAAEAAIVARGHQAPVAQRLREGERPDASAVQAVEGAQQAHLVWPHGPDNEEYNTLEHASELDRIPS
jgi:hypothetical protein